MRAFIHGSCVSRDLLAMLAGHGFELTHYSPRQSLIPLLGTIKGLTRYVDASRLTSRFQRRAVEGTLNADLLDQLDRHRTVSDMVLWDITDERLGVYAHNDTFVTRTVELISVGLDAALSQSARHIAFGSDEHFTLWSRALERWAGKIEESKLDDRIVLLAPRWASKFEDGTPTPDSFGLDAQTFESLSADYYAQAQHVLPKMRIVGREVPAFASTRHQWGPAPFHFSDETNHALAAVLYEIGYDPSSEFPPPLPTVVQTSENEFFVHSSTSWADEYALYVANKQGIVQKFPYQDSPEFRVTVEQTGTYRFRLFHKKDELRSVVYSEPMRVSL